MKSIAIISNGSFGGRAGFFYAVHNRSKFLQNHTNLQVDSFQFLEQPTLPARILWSRNPILKVTSTDNNGLRKFAFDGVEYNIFELPFTITDYIWEKKLHRTPIFREKNISKQTGCFKDYDLIISHLGASSSLLPVKIKERYGVPFVSVWHGSDINEIPFTSPYWHYVTAQLLRSSSENIFVSEALFATAKKEFPDISGRCIYNGVSSQFCVFDDEKRLALRKKHANNAKHIMGFVGNLVEIKNPFVLPEVFSAVASQLPDTEFWIFGQGKLRSELEQRLKDNGVAYRFFGHVPTEEIIEYYNCMDVMILPSFNEGLPLVSVEAQKCGCPVVGSDRGGIPEAIGRENAFALEDNFVEKVSNRAVELMKNPQRPEVPIHFTWEYCAEQEYNLLTSLLNSQGNFLFSEGKVRKVRSYEIKSRDFLG